LAISRNIEHQTGVSIKQFVKLLRPIRSGIVTINEREILAEPEIPEQVNILLKQNAAKPIIKPHEIIINIQPLIFIRF